MRSRLRPFAAFFAVVILACQASSSPPLAAPTPATRSLAVVVMVASGVPVVGANVCAFTVAGTQAGCGETSASGTARLGLRPGAYSVLVTPHAPTRLGVGRIWADVLDADATSVVQLEGHS